MGRVRALLFLSLFCLVQCKSRPAASDVDVAGGHTVASSHWLAKSVVMLGRGCSGVIISPYHVLTAGHCLNEGDTVFFGPDRKSAHRRENNKVISHPEYRRVDAKNLSNDLAIVTLAVPIPSGFEPLAVGGPKKTFSRGTYTVGGFGITANNAADQGRLHMLVPAKVKRQASARTYVLNFKKSQGVCGGDSGSGLVLEEKDERRVIGIASKANCEGGEATYVDLEPYRDWIAGVTAQKIFKKDTLKTKTYALTDVELKYGPNEVAASHRFSLPAAENERILSLEIRIEATQNKPGWLRFFFDPGPDYMAVSFLHVPAGESAPAQHHFAAEGLADFVGIPVRGSWEVTVRREDMEVLPQIKKIEFTVQSFEE